MKYGKFISDQKLRRLAYPFGKPLPVIDYLEHIGRDPNEFQGRPSTIAPEELWPEVNRFEYLSDLNIRRLCVTVEGGVGKSRLLEELEVLTEHSSPGHWVLKVDLRELPDRLGYFIDEEYSMRLADGSQVVEPPLLVTKATERFVRLRGMANSGLDFPSKEAIKNQLEFTLRSGDFTLIVDSVDQLDKAAAANRAKVLGEFLSARYPKIRCVIAGRPYAIKRIRSELELEATNPVVFRKNGSERLSQKPVWEFCYLEKFTRDQVVEYLSAQTASDGESKLSSLKRMNADDICLPRHLNIIRTLTSGELDELQTTSDLYWFTINRLLIENFRTVDTDFRLQRLQREHVIPIVSSIAFAMLTWKSTPILEIPSVAFSTREGYDTDEFFEYMEVSGFSHVLQRQGIEFRPELLELAQAGLDSILFHPYSETTSTAPPKRVVAIQMADATVRDFFAAHWAARFLDQQIDWMKLHRPAGLDVIDEPYSKLRESINLHDFKRFWTMLVGMPDQGRIEYGRAASEVAWTTAVSPLFLSKGQQGQTELMYRCWPDLLFRAGFMQIRDHTDRPNWNQTPMAEATIIAQDYVRREFALHFKATGNVTQSEIEDIRSARELVVCFLSDYLRQCKSQELACMSDPKVTQEIRQQFNLDCDFYSANDECFPKRPDEFETQRKERLSYLLGTYPLWLLERSFRVVDGGKFLFGEAQLSLNFRDRTFVLSDGPIVVHVDTFEINAYLVSNSMYSFFASDMQPNQPFTAKVGLSWFDSLMFSIWCHGQLPDENQWEAAARGKVGDLDITKHRKFGFPEDENDNWKYVSCNSIDDTSPIRVGHKLPTTQAELYDMHCVVVQWCADTKRHEFFVRTVRSGAGSSSGFRKAFINSSGFSSCDLPSYQSDKHGCRVARARSYTTKTKAN